MRRRTVLKSIATALVAAFLWPARAARAGKLAIGLDKLAKLKDVGSSMTIKLKGCPPCRQPRNSAGIARRYSFFENRPVSLSTSSKSFFRSTRRGV